MSTRDADEDNGDADNGDADKTNLQKGDFSVGDASKNADDTYAFQAPLEDTGRCC